MTLQWNLITTQRVDGRGMTGLGGGAVLREWCGVEGWVEGGGQGL